MARVAVFGHRGMLGRTVCAFLRQRGHTVLTSTERFDVGCYELLELARDADVLVNALGAIPQKCEHFYVPNVLFVQKLLIHSDRQRIVHASTDCVFEGTTGSYTVSSRHDASSQYGQTKATAERLLLGIARAVVVRASIIGPGGGLLQWLLEQKGPVKGFTNHRWNGITSLSWAEIAADVCEGKREPGLIQPGFWPPISKHALLEAINDCWRLGLRIEPVEAEQAVDRSLAPTELRDLQLGELKAFWESDAFTSA